MIELVCFTKTIYAGFGIKVRAVRSDNAGENKDFEKQLSMRTKDLHLNIWRSVHHNRTNGYNINCRHCTDMYLVCYIIDYEIEV